MAPAGARASALYDLPLKPIEPELPLLQGKSDVTIDIQEPVSCVRVSRRAKFGVTIMPSLPDVAGRLQLLDQRPIVSNAVDATNYVLWESGKPTHAFDPRSARRTTTDHSQSPSRRNAEDAGWRGAQARPMIWRSLPTRKLVGLAGVMGGFETMDHREDEEHPDRIRVVEPGHGAADVEAARPA